MPDIKDSDQFVLSTLPDHSGERKLLSVNENY